MRKSPTPITQVGGFLHSVAMVPPSLPPPLQPANLPCLNHVAKVIAPDVKDPDRFNPVPCSDWQARPGKDRQDRLPIPHRDRVIRSPVREDLAGRLDNGSLHDDLLSLEAFRSGENRGTG